MSFSRSAATLAVALVITGTQLAAEPSILKYKFKNGDKLSYVMESKMAMTMSFMGMEVKTDMTQAMDMTWSIHSVDADGKATITQKFDRLQFKMENPMVGVMEFDSKEGKKVEGPAAALINPALEAMADAEISMTMDAYGNIGDVKVPEKLQETLKNTAGAAGFGNTFSEDGFKNMLGQGGLVFPKDGIGKGKSWNQKTEVKSPVGKMIADVQFTYDGADGDRHKFSTVPKLTIEADPNAQFKMEIKAHEGKGTATFDSNLGRLLSSEMKQTSEMEIEVAGQTIPQKMEQITTLKLRDAAK